MKISDTELPLRGKRSEAEDIRRYPEVIIVTFRLYRNDLREKLKC